VIVIVVIEQNRTDNDGSEWCGGNMRAMVASDSGAIGSGSLILKAIVTVIAIVVSIWDGLLPCSSSATWLRRRSRSYGWL
jgi:hypothetical protein